MTYRIFHRTTPIRITLLIISMYLIAYSVVHTDAYLAFLFGTFALTCREYIYNIEFYHGFLHYYNEKILGKKVEPNETDEIPQEGEHH